MANTKKNTENVNQGHMPRRGSCKKSDDGLHTPQVYTRTFYQVVDERTKTWPRLPVGLYVREFTRCADCGKIRYSTNERVDNVNNFLIAGEKSLLVERYEK